MSNRLFAAVLIPAFLLGTVFVLFNNPRDTRVLVFSKTEGYRHQSIEAGKEAIRTLGRERGFEVETTEDASVFRENRLRDFNAVVFLNTTGDVLNEAQQTAFTRFIQAGGGFVGIHAAADTEYDWPWYGRLVGGYFQSHPNDPNVRDGDIHVADSSHPMTAMLPQTWERTDEWYDYKSFNEEVTVLLNVDESSYKRPDENPTAAPRPIAWYHEMDGGRAFYTGLGHTEESFSEPLYLAHLRAGLEYTMGNGTLPDFTAPNVSPEPNRFTKVVLDQNLNEPMEFELLPDGRILFIERRGRVRLHDPELRQTETIATFDVYSGQEDGLIGVALDPDYATNNWIYFIYSPVGDEAKQHVSRFVLTDGNLDMDSEKVVFVIPTQRDQCCHAGGSLEFDADGNLYISTGDDTNPFASNGFAPIDEQDGRKPWDAQRTSGNTNDLRGKILRIKPEPDGTYSIPDGNLFPRDGSVGRPEIYVMGNRNPFRIAIDKHTGYLYWGEVGPDAGDPDSLRGPQGHDEINQARRAGNFGWPYFVGNNKPYRDYDFSTETHKAPFDPAHPINDSPNNTGARELPAAQSAFIWYPYGPSAEFPLVGEGGRTAMAGPVFYYDDYTEGDHTFPRYYDGKLFIYEWMRGWIMSVTMDENGDFVNMEEFMPHIEFNNPVDMLFSPDGVMYVLEYGTKWNAQNLDARISRIEFTRGNRIPVARIAADQTIGASPLTVRFDGSKSVDFDDDALTYSWDFEGTGQAQSTETNPTFTFDEPGSYEVQLTVRDPEGLSASSLLNVQVGNDIPELRLQLSGNQTFYWDNRVVAYEVQVTDTEDGSLADGSIEPGRVSVSFDYLPEGDDMALPAVGHQVLMNAADAMLGKSLVDGSDCLACHQPEAASIGPSFKAIAERYAEEEGAPAILSNKIIQGGGGVWGDQAMAAHPQHTLVEAEKMIRYILSFVEDTEPSSSAPPKGTFRANQHTDQGKDGRYILMATYTDNGASGIGPITAQETLTLRHPRIKADSFDEGEKASRFTIPDDAPMLAGQDIVMGTGTGHVIYKNIDLTDIDTITLGAILSEPYTQGGTIAIHLGSPEGTLLGTASINQAGLHEYTLDISATWGLNDIVLVFNTNTESEELVCMLDWIRFNPRTDG